MTKKIKMGMGSVLGVMDILLSGVAGKRMGSEEYCKGFDECGAEYTAFMDSALSCYYSEMSKSDRKVLDKCIHDDFMWINYDEDKHCFSGCMDLSDSFGEERGQYGFSTIEFEDFEEVGKIGVINFIAIKRNEKPLKSFIEDEAWDGDENYHLIENLPDNAIDIAKGKK